MIKFRFLTIITCVVTAASCCGNAEPDYIENPVDYVSTLVGSESTFQLST